MMKNIFTTTCKELKGIYYILLTLPKHYKRVHLEDFLFECDECDFKTDNMGQVTGHIASHEGSGVKHPEFDNTTSLARHKQIHEPEVDVSCDNCAKEFNRERALAESL